MISRAVSLLVAVCALGLSATLAQAQRIQMRYEREGKKPKYTTLDQQLHQVEEELDLPVGGKESIAVKADDKTGLKLDTTGDGRLDKLVSPGDLVSLRLMVDNKLYPYQLRYVLDQYQRRCVTSACAYSGMIGQIRIAIIDANLNGKFNDYGDDYMTLGKVPYAYPLSKTIVFGKKSYTLEVAQSGQHIDVTPNDEELQKVDFISQFSGSQKPKMVVFKRDKGWSGEHVALYPRHGSYLPIDEWAFAYAVFTDKLWAKGSDLQVPIELKKGAALIKWGKPYHLELDAEVAEEGVKRTVTQPGAWLAPKLIETKVDGTHVKLDMPHIVGRGGERYIGNWRHADNWGIAMADPNIARFQVKITQGGRVLNASQSVWKRLDMSGLVKKTRPFWVPYEWPSKTAKGKLKIEVFGSSNTFGSLSTKKPVEVEVD